MTTEWSAISTYESYKDSGIEWIGNIPDHWEIKPLRRISKVHSGNGFPIELQGKEEGTVPFIKVSDFSSSKRYLFTANNHVSEKVITRKKWNKVPKNCLVTAKIGEALRKNHRNLLGCDAIIDNNCIGFEPTGVDLRFFYYLNTIIDFDWFTNTGPVPSISVQKYRSWKVAIPTVEEQQDIAKFLDEKTTQIDQAIEIKKRQICLLKERKQIIIQHAVTKGLDPTAHTKHSGSDWIGDIPMHWEMIPNKRLFSIRKDVVGKRSADYDLLSLTLKGVIKRNMDNPEGKFPAEFDTYQIVDKNDFVFCLFDVEETPRTVGLSKNYGMITGAYTVMTLRHSVNPEYIEQLYIVLDQQKKFRSLYKGLRNTIPKDIFGRIKTPIPPRNEQDEIVEFISQNNSGFDQVFNALSQQILNLKEYKASLINSAVTGKIKVI